MKNRVDNLKRSLYIDKVGHKLSFKPTGKNFKHGVRLFSNPSKPGSFVFPRRRRFNEDVEKEIKS